ncbi:hypothetical protein B0H11DRAFT_2171411 [Mycena galericulata]|nr:hypothetical protein B0H11DRAFT_2171411 [Mycena galericulata]
MSAPKQSSYNITRHLNETDPSEFYEQTVARLNQIKAHVAVKSGDCMRSRVCIVTGADFLNGIGAKHIYVLDKMSQNLPNLKATVGEKYPGVKVTGVEADAADEMSVESICKLALAEEGRLDVFFCECRGIYHHSAI